MKNLYRKHLQIKYLGQLTLESLTDFKNLHQNEFMDELLSDDASAIEMDVLGRVLSWDEKKSEREILLSPAIVRLFVTVKTQELNQSKLAQNRFFELSDDEQKQCLKYVIELRKDGKRAAMFAQRFHKMGMQIDYIPEKYIDMSNEQLQAEINGWRITFDAK